MQLPDSGRIDVSWYWQLGWNNHTYIAATDYADPDPYDVVIKAGDRTGATSDNYFYFTRYGKFQLPVDGDIVDSNGDSVLNKDMPQQTTENANYTLRLSDRGKHIYVNYTGVTVLIPINDEGSGGVAFPIGTCITIVTASGCPATLAPLYAGTTTLVLSKFGSDPSINIAADTYVTLLKIDTDKWIVQT
jgi:hypothetical protein